MTADRPTIEQRAPGVLVVRYEWREQLDPAWQAELVARCAAGSAAGPVALVFVLADRIRDIPPTVRGFWRTITGDERYRIGAVAVVTASWGVEVSAAGFGVTNALSGAPLQVRTFTSERDAEAWATGVARPLPEPASA